MHFFIVIMQKNLGILVQLSCGPLYFLLVDIALDFIAKCSPNDLELFFVVVWSIRWNRNQAIHEDSSSPPIHA